VEAQGKPNSAAAYVQKAGYKSYQDELDPDTDSDDDRPQEDLQKIADLAMEGVPDLHDRLSKGGLCEAPLQGAEGGATGGDHRRLPGATAGEAGAPEASGAGSSQEATDEG